MSLQTSSVRPAWRRQLALAVLATIAWLSMAGDVVTGQDPDPWEVRLHAALYAWRHDTLTWLMDPVDELVDHVVTLSLAAFLVVQCVRRDWRSFFTLLAVIAGGALLNHGIKEIVERTRPGMQALALLGDGDFGFPSGHTIAITLLAGWVIHSACAATSRLASRVAVAAVCALGVLVVAYSRIYVGAHYPGDVAAGMLVGAAWLCTCLAASQAFWNGRAIRAG